MGDGRIEDAIHYTRSSMHACMSPPQGAS